MEKFLALFSVIPKNICFDPSDGGYVLIEKRTRVHMPDKMTRKNRDHEYIGDPPTFPLFREIRTDRCTS